MVARRAILLATLLLSACSASSSVIKPLPVADVLSRAADASAKLQTAQYTIDGTFAVQTPDSGAQGNIRIDGVLADAGKQVQLQMALTGTYNGQGGQANSLDGTMEVVVAGSDGVYMKLDALNVQPSGTLIPPEILEKFAGKWWRLPDNTTVPATEVTPDPTLLRAQSQVVNVTSDHGIETLDGNPVYHYDVGIDPQKFVHYLSAVADQKHEAFNAEQTLKNMQSVKASGELWIDAVSFELRKARWDVQGLPLTSSNSATLNCSFTAALRNLNASVKITPPEGAQQFNPALLLSEPLPPNAENAILPGASSTTNSLSKDLLQNLTQGQ